MLVSHRLSYRVLYTIYGALFGVCFPLGAWAADILIFRGLNFDLAGIAATHVQNPLHYIIDTAPLFLGLFAGFAGVRQDRLHAFAAQLERLVDERTAQLRAKTADLEASEAALRGAKSETDAILANITDGLFLLGPDHRLAGEHSASLAAMLRRSDPAGANLIEIIGAGASADLADQCELFFPMMFDAARPETLVARANPLSEIRLFDRILRFGFRRINVNGQVARLLGFVVDATQQVELESRVDAERQRAESQMKLVFSLLHVAPVMLTDFLDQVGEMIDAASRNIEENQAKGEYRALLEVLYRLLHTLKGNASTLGLDAFANAAHDAENQIEVLRAKPEPIAGKDFLELVLALNAIKKIHQESCALLERMGQMNAALANGPAPDRKQLLIESLAGLIQRRSRETGREIIFDGERLDPEHVEQHGPAVLRDVLVQLIRNSIAHGIEDPAERMRRGKPAAGSIRVRSAPVDGGVEIIFEDDGRGIDVAGLKARAITAGRLSAAEASALGVAEAARLIFTPGISTAGGAGNTATLDAGRGVGMDVVRERVRGVGGRIDVAFAPGRFCRFTIYLPAAKN